MADRQIRTVRREAQSLAFPLQETLDSARELVNNDTSSDEALMQKHHLLNQQYSQLTELDARWKKELDAWETNLHNNPDVTQQTALELERSVYDSKASTYKKTFDEIEKLLPLMEQQTETRKKAKQQTPDLSTIQRSHMNIQPLTNNTTQPQEVTPNSVTSPFLSTTMNNTTQARTSHQPGQIRIDMPKQQLPAFSGEPTEFLTFWNRFQNLIGSNPDMSKLTKLDILLGCMVPNSAAATVLVDIDMLVETEYDRALQKLAKRYGNVEKLTDNLLLKMEKLPKPTEEGTSLRQYADRVSGILAQLKILDRLQPESRYLKRLLEGALPRNILLSLRLNLGAGNASVTQLVEHIHTYAEAFDDLPSNTFNKATAQRNQRFNSNHTTASTPKSVDTDATTAFTAIPRGRGGRVQRGTGRGRFQNKTRQRQPTAFQNGSTSSSSNSSSNKKIALSRGCIFCSDNHRDAQCPKFSTMATRRRQLLDKQLCTLCIQPGHKWRQCPEKETRKCFFCKAIGSHYSALCAEKFSSQGHAEKFRSPKSLSTITEDREDSTFTGVIITGCCDNDDNNKETSYKEPGLKETTDKTFTGVSSNGPINAVLPTALVHIQKETGEQIQVQAVLDTGSMRNFIEDNVAEAIGMTTETTIKTKVDGICNTSTQLATSKVGWIKLMLDDGNIQEIRVQTTPKITRRHNYSTLLCAEDQQFLEDLTDSATMPSILADKVMEQPFIFDPQLLIGNGIFPQLLEPNCHSIQLPSSLMAIPTKLGYVLFGQAKGTGEENINPHNLFAETYEWSTKPLWEATSETFSSLETLGIEAPSTQDAEDDLAEQQFASTVCYTTEEPRRVQVCWPYRDKEPNIDDNKDVAMGCLTGLVQRLKSNPELANRYAQRIEEQITAGVVEEAPSEPDGMVYYTPHHAVLTPEKTTTKLRVVSNASSKSRRKGSKSLNDIMLRGPIKLPMILTLLLLFRTFTIAIASDIEKAFLNVALRKDQRDVTRYLWLKDPTKLSTEPDNIRELRYTRVSFGNNASPYMLLGSLFWHLDNQNNTFATQMKSRIYMDNILVGAENAKEAIEIYKKSKDIFNQISMNLREFVSNCPELYKHIEEARPSDLASRICKILGITWDSIHDTIWIRGLNISKSDQNAPLTREQLLSNISSIYDPLGLVSAITLDAKLMFQRTWSDANLDWKDPLPDSYQTWWKEAKENLKRINEIIIPRCIKPKDTKSCTLHIFVDGSSQAYAALCYLRFETDTDIQCQLLTAKTRLAPTKQRLTIPRMELLSGLIGFRSLSFILDSYNDNAFIQSAYVWTDSTISLSWMTNKTDVYKVWVTNRVREIQQITDNAKIQVHIKYVPTNQNPADLCTRPTSVTIDVLKDMSHWYWTGPDFLKKDEIHWPEQPNISKLTTEEELFDKQERKTRTTTLINSTNKPTTWFPFETIATNLSTSKPSPLKSSTPIFTRVVRVMSLVLRFIANTFGELFNKWPAKMQPFVKDITSIESFSYQLLHTQQHWSFAMTTLLIDHQQIYFHDVINNDKHQLRATLRLIIDDNGLLRVQHRLKTKRQAPILIHNASSLAHHIIMDAHRKMSHLGMPSTLNETRRQGWWIPKGRATTKRSLKSCSSCKFHFEGAYTQPPFPDQPLSRTTKAAPFSRIGIDYFGPINVRDNNTTSKVWTFLATCFISRAIHMEVVSSLTPAEFLMAFIRFASRRGTPNHVYTDNSTTFLAAKSDILKHQQNATQQEDDDVNDYFNGNLIWHHITPMASWQGGLYERQIGTVKRALKASCSRKKIMTMTEFHTAICKAEAAVNSRPLTYVAADEPTVLKPSDMICNNTGTNFLDFELDGDADDPDWITRLDHNSLLSTWHRIEEHQQEFFNAWDDYIESSRETAILDHKRPKGSTDDLPQIGRLVLIKEPNRKRFHWPIAQIIELNRSADGHIRSCKLRTIKGRTLERAVSFLHPFEVEPAEINIDVKDTKEENVITADNSSSDTSSINQPPRRSARLKAKAQMNSVACICLAMMILLPTTAATPKVNSATCLLMINLVPGVMAMDKPGANAINTMKTTNFWLLNTVATVMINFAIIIWFNNSNKQRRSLHPKALRMPSTEDWNHPFRIRRDLYVTLNYFASITTEVIRSKHYTRQLLMNCRSYIAITLQINKLKKQLSTLTKITRLYQKIARKWKNLILQARTEMYVRRIDYKKPILRESAVYNIHTKAHKRSLQYGLLNAAWLRRNLKLLRDSRTLLAIVAILSVMESTSGQCDTNMPPNNTIDNVLWIDTCKPKGLSLYMNGNQLCSTTISCPGHQVLNKNMECIDSCEHCPHQFNCNYPIDINKLPTHLQEMDLQREQKISLEGVCALSHKQRSPNCSLKSHKITLNEVILRNGKRFTLQNLHLQFEDSRSNFTCASITNRWLKHTPYTQVTSAVTGSTEFCSSFNCTANATAYCYKRHQQRTYYITSRNIQIPIYAWRTFEQNVYDYKLSEDINCSMNCTKTGVQFRCDTSISTALICASLPSEKCTSQKNIQDTSSANITLPPEIKINTHDVIIQIWKNGIQKATLKRSCNRTSVCEYIKCIWCLDNIVNTCTPVSTKFITIIILILTIDLLIFTTFFIITRHRQPELQNFIRKKADCLMRWYRVYIYPYIPQRFTQESRTETEICVWKPSNQRQITTKSRLLLIITTICILEASPAYACQLNAALTAQMVSCTKNTTNVDCTVNAAVRSVQQVGSTTCLNLTRPDGSNFGSLQITLNGITSTCSKNHLYWTRDVITKVASIKRCGLMGSCGLGGSQCSKLKTSESVKELEPFNDKLGRNFCTTSCGSITCLCALPIPGCLFYKVFPDATSPHIYEVFNCVEWEDELDLTLKIISDEGSWTQNITLGTTDSAKTPTIEISLVSTEKNLVSILQSDFLMKNDGVAAIEAAPRGFPTAGKIGMLQCESSHDALNISKENCLWQEDCTCTPGQNSVSCACTDITLEKVFNDSTRTLPLHLPSLTLSTLKNNVVAHWTHHTTAELHMNLSNLTVTFTSTENNCTISHKELNGCYACYGATVQLTCKSSQSSTVATIQCASNHQTTVKCTPEGELNTLIMNYDVEDVDDRCLLKCSKPEEFTIRGKLARIPLQALNAYGTVSQSNNTRNFEEINWPKITNLFSITTADIPIIIIGAATIALVTAGCISHQLLRSLMFAILLCHISTVNTRPIIHPNTRTWGKNNISWHVDLKNQPSKLHPLIEKDIQDMIALWTDVANLFFNQVKNISHADIKISFETHRHGDVDFSTTGGSLAHAFYPTDGRIHINSEEKWTFGKSTPLKRNSISFAWVILHEIGHSLGLHHLPAHSAIMNPIYNPDTSENPAPHLDVNDVKAIQLLYGRPQTLIPSDKTLWSVVANRLNELITQLQDTTNSIQLRSDNVWHRVVIDVGRGRTNKKHHLQIDTNVIMWYNDTSKQWNQTNKGKLLIPPILL